MLICKCCGKEARWCGDGDKACGVEHCAHIHCDHCGMHYSLESEAALGALTMEEDRALMLAAYNARVNPVAEGDPVSGANEGSTNC